MYIFFNTNEENNCKTKSLATLSDITRYAIKLSKKDKKRQFVTKNDIHIFKIEQEMKRRTGK